jgi:lambda repressor-like predicted transcriptional regulator
MESSMPREDLNEQFRELDAQIASLRAAAKSLGDERPSWFEHLFHPGRRARRQADFSAAIVAALKEAGATIRKTTANTTEHLSNLEAEIARLHERHEQSARESADAAQTTRQQLEQQLREQVAKIEQLGGAQSDFANEFRERIQHILDEQRVAIRQVSLKASEDAILSDRARRATELKLEELAKRIPPPPA